MSEEEIKTIHVNAQPIEISVTVSNEVTAKGDLKPSASVRVTRLLIDGTKINAFVKDAIELGVKETGKAIKEALKVGNE